MVKNSLIEKTYVVRTHLTCLISRQFQCISTTYVTENKEENYLRFPSIMSIVFTSLKHPKLPVNIKILVTLL